MMVKKGLGLSKRKDAKSNKNIKAGIIALVIILSLLIQASNIGFSATNSPPSHSSPLILSSDTSNTTLEGLTCYNQSTSDPDSDPVTNIYNWYRDSESINVLNIHAF